MNVNRLLHDETQSENILNDLFPDRDVPIAPEPKAASISPSKSPVPGIFQKF
jgi:hypothetical protein